MYIEKIQSPADLKGLSLAELKTVADETRAAVLNRVSKHGGHVGPNLGFVEATVALHYVFDAPKDKFVFDVSHQCYPHKVLTGRASGFLGEMSDMNAISGYSSPAESPEYDNFEVGHTSTSISLATGLQKARDIKGTHENIIAIIGDGSLSGGEAFEGLDEASELGTGIIIVVNDNEMSIAENHGGIYKNLRALRESRGTCQHNWFKAWGFEYKYLEEGNDVEKLIEVFRSVKDTDTPTTCEEYFAMLRWAIRQEAKPIAIRVPSNGVVHTTEDVDEEYSYTPKYKVAHEGSQVAIIAAGSFYQKGENVAHLLAEKGIDATLINPRYLHAVDAETLESLKARHQLVVTLEDGCKDGGFGERIASYYGTSDMKVLVCGVKKDLYDRFDHQQLLADNRLLANQIADDILNIIKK